MNISLSKFFFCSVSIALSFSAISQVFRPGDYEQTQFHIKYIEDPNSDYLTRHIVFSDSLVEVESLELLPVRFGVLHNTTYPQGFNDGAMWAGKGVTADLSAGFYGKWKRLEYSIYPRVFLSQNSPFDLADQRNTSKSPLNYQFNIGGDIDYVQRYGEKAFFNFGWGQSELRYRGKYLTTAISSANFTIGVASQHPIMLSRQAGGYPHFEIGTAKPLNLKIKNLAFGKIHLNYILGITQESKYFDSYDLNNERFISSLVGEYYSERIDGFKLGFSRIFYQDMEFFQKKDLFRSIWYFGYDNRDNFVRASGDTINDYLDQMASVYASYHLKESKARIYGEFAKNDFTGSSKDFLTSTDHARAFLIGFDKLFITGKSKVLFTYEHTNLSRSGTFRYRAEPTYYIHGVSRGGYSHNGQLLGAGIGPGSNSHMFKLTSSNQKHLWSISGYRIQTNEDYFQSRVAKGVFFNRKLRWVEYGMPFQYTWHKDNLSLSACLFPSIRLNEYFVRGNDKFNAASSITLNYNLR